jgi:hypothetical protein
LFLGHMVGGNSFGGLLGMVRMSVLVKTEPTADEQPIVSTTAVSTINAVL